MDLFPLPLLPPGSLDSSVVTTTLVGVFVLAFFNLRFGWVLSGIVVPGYLVPLLLIKPVSALVIGVEAVVTYLIVWLLSEQVSRTGLWSSVFGRDRFFLIVVVSIIVRVTFDGFLLPEVGRALLEAGVSFDYQNVLHSFGLIVIALLANQFWKTGLARGIPHAVIVTAVTYLIVRYGLMEVTNFRMADIGYLYEDLASSVLATPKAYIILVTTAFIASRLNLHYGWDFNGILIPSLIALQWFQPLKVVASIAEAFVILGIAVLLLRTPLFANRTMEGARKLLLFFSIAFAYRYTLGWTLPLVDSDIKVTDTFGFGYLLSTLIAIKIHDKGIPARLTRATLQVSVMGLAFGTAIGFTLSEAATVNLLRVAAPRDAPASVPAPESARPLEAVIADFKIGVYGASIASAAALPDVAVREGFARAARAALDGDVAMAAERLAEVGGRLTRTAEGLVVMDVAGRPAWGLYAIDPAAESDLVVEVADPLGRQRLIDAAAVLFRGLGARAIVLGGATAAGSVGTAAAPGFATLYHAVHQAVATGPVLMVDGAADDGAGAVLHLEAPVPAALDTAALDRVVGPLAFRFGRPEEASLQAVTAPYLARLSLDGEAVRSALFRGGGVAREAVRTVDVANAADHLRRRLLAAPDDAASAARVAYRPPTLQELLFADAEVVTPLLEAARADQPDLAALAHAAASGIGYRVLRLDDPGSGAWYVLERDPAAEEQLYWGTHVFRIGAAASYALQVPRPAVELNTLETGLDLLGRLDARAFTVTTAHVLAPDPAADVTRPENAASLFTLVSQVMLREARAPFTIVQVRGFAATPDIDADAVVTVASADPASRADADDPALRPVTGALEALGLSLVVSDGGEEEAAIGGGAVPQRAYLEATRAGRFVLVWLSPETRTAFAAADTDERVLAASLGVALETAEVASVLAARGLAPAGTAERAFADTAAAWRRSGDVVVLHQGLEALRAAGLGVRLVVDRVTLRGVFALLTPDGAVTALIRTAAPEPARTVGLAAPGAVSAFLRGPAAAALVEAP